MHYERAYDELQKTVSEVLVDTSSGRECYDEDVRHYPYGESCRPAQTYQQARAAVPGNMEKFNALLARPATFGCRHATFGKSYGDIWMLPDAFLSKSKELPKVVWRHPDVVMRFGECRQVI